MKTRIITALLCVPLLFIALLSGSVVITVAVLCVSLVGSYEFYKAVGISNKIALCIIGYAGCIIIPLLTYLSSFVNLTSVSFLFVFLALFFLFLILLLKHNTTKVEDVGLILLSMIYIPYFLSNIITISLMENGKFYIWFVFIGAFLTDSFAYFSGIFLGKHKLCPNISPKKTIEGAIGGIIGCMIFFLLYAFFLDKSWNVDISFLKIGILGLIVATVAEIGDLAASIIKRQYGIKDYGTIFPGHGGILDRCDSVILVAPVIYLFLLLVGI